MTQSRARSRGRRQTPGERAAGRIGAFPVTVSRARGPAMRHAFEVWSQAISGMVNRSAGLLRAAGGVEAAYLGQVDLAFLATVAAHLERCERCEKRWIDGEVPYELLTAAIRRRPAGTLLAVIAREQRAQMGR